MDNLKKLEDSLLSAPVVRRGEYEYFIHPLTDGIPPLTPGLLTEVCGRIQDVVNPGAEKILTMEAMGIHFAAVLSVETGMPLNIVRKRQYWLPGEVVLDQATGYSKGKLYINAVNAGDRLLVVDAVISTGGTLTAVLNALKKIGAEVVDVVCVIERGDGVAKVKKETGFDVKTLVKIEVRNGKVDII
ncbi:MAG: hypoxanthine/guanine phosphoribosyltransferase [Candidatus Altiarchaeota archaeon]